MDKLMDEDANPEQRQSGQQHCGDLKQREGRRRQVDCGTAVPDGHRDQKVGPIEQRVWREQILNKLLDLPAGKILVLLPSGSR